MLPLLRREYLLSAVHWLKNRPKILHITQRDFFNMNYIHRDESIWYRCCHLALHSVLAHSPYYLSEWSSETRHLDIYIITFLAVCKFKNTFSIRVIFFFENVLNFLYISKMEKKIEKIFVVSEIIASEKVAINCLY